MNYTITISITLMIVFGTLFYVSKTHAPESIKEEHSTQSVTYGEIVGGNSFIGYEEGKSSHQYEQLKRGMVYQNGDTGVAVGDKIEHKLTNNNQ